MKSIKMVGGAQLLGILAVFGAILSVTALIPGQAEAATTCGFYRDLGVGDIGDDVRCLKRFLNDEYLSKIGYTLGNESTVFTNDTKQAVIWWQESQGITPATGFFGPVSRARYSMGMGRMSYRWDDTYSYRGVVNDNTIRALIDDADTAIEDADDEVSRTRNSSARRNAENLIDDARDNLDRARTAYRRDDFADAVEFARDAIRDAQNAVDKADRASNGDKNKAKNAINNADKIIKDVWKEIDRADDRGDYVTTAEDLIREAQVNLSDARGEYTDRNYDDAYDLAVRAKEEAQDARTEIRDRVVRYYNYNYDDTDDRLNDTWDRLADAWDEVRDARRNGRSINTAEDLLDRAEEKLFDAEDELDRGDEDDADDLIDDADDLIEDALDRV